MDYGLFFSAILGSAGVFSLIQFFVTRYDRKKDVLGEIKSDVLGVRKAQDEINVRVTRMELLALIRDDPNNIDAILQVAEYYFIELDGNAYAHAVFEKWAEAHGVAIGWLPKLTRARNGKNNNFNKEEK